jgi:predicted Fe-Mo cluster-binding NifX family protein
MEPALRDTSVSTVFTKAYMFPDLTLQGNGIAIAFILPEVMTLRIAVPVWKGRISPVLDVATELLLVDADAGQETARTEERFTPGLLPERVRMLSDLGVDAVICGTVSRQMASMLAAQGVTIFPCMRGEVDDVIGSVVRSGVPDSRFFMPGYDGRPVRRRWRGRYGRLGQC